ncbi:MULTISPECIES: RrF2 family transcriptional regulator [Gluconobacter]|uniref:Rrf2 family transcriptional regulator n=1 Tax=Gluconobacter albidus TaxID=318683 RepID=A0A149T3V9_9PROT|nr:MULTISPECIES: Rrf2 family transcriptional regulator [Gluconobacter]AQS91814.1 Rrf2 family transcriptional regulator [Gluconobacter albidus]KXV41115.1 Rrf2 family transcriptional regulator [Gluconobacter albidus]KXV47699.1 Rrf2 family transcriptional regulator [Gluconobacter albidus]MBS1028583.1 Rrf2 family transcriptional regulator [Gluconobacter albidus]MCP1274184.1 Rrf2 family transcriptional regulator [Gluconobacter albidus]
MYLRRDRALTAVSIMLDVAFHAGRSGVVSGADIARRGDMLRRGIEPVLQGLSRAGLLASVRGPKGGYRLGRPPRTITLNEIVRTVTEDPDMPEEGVNLLRAKVLEPFWQQMDQEVSEKMASVTLEHLLQNAEEAGMQRPNRAPISFSI